MTKTKKEMNRLPRYVSPTTEGKCPYCKQSCFNSLLDSDVAGAQATMRGLDTAREALSQQVQATFDARGMVTGSRPAGFTSPKRTSATARPPSWPGIHA